MLAFKRLEISLQLLSTIHLQLLDRFESLVCELHLLPLIL